MVGHQLENVRPTSTAIDVRPQLVSFMCRGFSDGAVVLTRDVCCIPSADLWLTRDEPRDGLMLVQLFNIEI